MRVKGPVHKVTGLRLSRVATPWLWRAESCSSGILPPPSLSRWGQAFTISRMRPIWSGAVSFGLVTIPVRLYRATTSRRPRFRQLRRADHSRIRYRKVAEADGQEVPSEDIVRGFEVDKGRYVVFTDEEIEGAGYQGGPRIVDVIEFVDAVEIDPIYYRTSYYVEPESTGQKAYTILRQALAEKNRIGIAKVAIRARVHLAALRALDDVLVLETMYWPDEVRQVGFETLNGELDVRENEVAMAEMLIENLTGEFDPAAWKDATRERIEELARRKIEGEEIVVPHTPEPTRVVDLLEALKASVEATRGEPGHRKAG